MSSRYILVARTMAEAKRAARNYRLAGVNVVEIASPRTLDARVRGLVLDDAIMCSPLSLDDDLCARVEAAIAPSKATRR